jgi:hypothetical protein
MEKDDLQVESRTGAGGRFRNKLRYNRRNLVYSLRYPGATARFERREIEDGWNEANPARELRLKTSRPAYFARAENAGENSKVH